MCIMQAFFTFYTVWFTAPAFISVILCIYQLNSKSWDNIACIFFAFSISLWSTVFIERWKRKEYHIQQQWGMVTEKEQNDTTLNPDFIGYNKFSWTYYDVQKESKTFETRLIIALNICVSLVMIIIQIFAYFVVKKQTNFNNYLTGILISFISGCINVVYKEMASRFVIWENHKYLKDKDGSFMLKIVIFSTINTNLPFVYSILFPDTQTEIEKPFVKAANQKLLQELGYNASQTYINAVKQQTIYFPPAAQVLGTITAKILSAIFTRYFYRFFMFNVNQYLYFRKVKQLGSRQQQQYNKIQFQNLTIASQTEIKLKEQLYIYKGILKSDEPTDQAIGKVNPDGQPLQAKKAIYQRLIFNNDTQVKPKTCDCSEHQTYLLDAVEINSIMPIKTELMKISDMTEKLQLVGCSMLYAGICPIGTAIVFIYFIADEYMTRYTDCYCMQRPLQENQMSLGTWILVVEFIVGFVTISNSLVLFLVSQRFKDFLTYSLGIAPQNHLWFVGIFEHFLLATIIITKVMIPDFPRPLQKYFESTKKQLERFSQQQKKDKYKIVLEENKQLLALIAKQTNGKVNTKHLLKLAHERDKPPQLVDFFDFNNAQKSNQLLISGFDQCLINNMKQKVMRDTYFRLEQSVIAEKLAKLNFMNQSLIISCNKCNKVGADMYCDDCKSYFCPDCVEMHHAVNFKEHVYGKLDCGPKAKQTNIPLKRRRFSRYHSAEIEDGKADWKKLECFDFSVNNMSPKQNKFRNYFNNVYLLFIDLNDIDRNNGQLDLTQVFLAKNYSIFQKEIGLKYKEQKKKLINQVFQEKEILSFDELTKGQFNTEELSVMNRVAYCQFLKYGHHAKFDNFYNDLQIYQEGSFEDKITLWLSHLCLLNDKLTDHISQLFQEQVPIQQKRLGVDLLKKTINNSFPQEVRLGLIAGQIIESMFGSKETLKIDKIKSYLHKNEPAMLLMQCILQSHNENPE